MIKLFEIASPYVPNIVVYCPVTAKSNTIDLSGSPVVK
jgi:hypothetical protein